MRKAALIHIGKAKYEDTCEKVLGWVDSMRDFDWCSCFQDSLDELVRIVGAEPKDSDRPDYKFTQRKRAARGR